MKSFIINYKAYKEGVDLGLDIAKAAAEVSEKTGVDVIVAPPFTLLRESSKMVKTIAQSIDDKGPGAFTAHVSWYEIKKSGSTGTLLNHSEYRYVSEGENIDYARLGKAIDACKQNGLFTYVCVQNVSEAGEVLKLRPTAIAYEPPELIGGDISVSTAKPEMVKEFCDIVKNVSGVLPLIGAGIKTANDVKTSVDLGSEGILVASGVMEATDFKNVILELAEPLR